VEYMHNVDYHNVKKEALKKYLAPLLAITTQGRLVLTMTA